MKEVILIVILVLVIGAGISVFYIQQKLKRISRAAFGTDSLIEGIKKQEELAAERPKSVSGMTKLCLPRIIKDFPEFSYEEFLQKSENQLKEALAAVENQDMACLKNPSPDLKNQIRLWIEDDKRQGIREKFQNIRIHQSAISRYEKAAGCCTVVFQSAVEYRYARWKKEEKEPELKKKQTRYDMEWVYVQDVEKLPEKMKAFGVNCPNCGAPLKNLGAKFCEYCGLAMETINIRAWSLHNIEEN